MKVRLPSGRAVVVSAKGTAIADDVVDGRAMFAGRLRNAVARGAFEARDGDRTIDVEELVLRDFHALRHVAEDLGAIAGEAGSVQCPSCESEVEAWCGPDGLFDMDEWYGGKADEEPPIKTKLRNGEKIELTEVSAKEARALHRALASSSFRVTPSVARGLGVIAIGKERDPRRIARKLTTMSDADFDVVMTAFHDRAYSPRGYRPMSCAKCGNVCQVDAPFAREASLIEEVFAGSLEGMPTEKEFAERAFAIADEVYAAKGVDNIELVVEAGVPPVDIGGTPLLGSYEPLVPVGAALDAGDVGFRISVFYRSFVRDYEQAPYDVEAELRETIEHEVDHHLAYLSGHDAVDEEERAEAERDVREVFGERRVKLAQQRAATRGVREVAIVFAVAVLALLGTIAAYAIFFD